MSAYATGGHMPPPAPAERYTGHDLCSCGHYRASHTPIENNTRGACYDPDRECTCRTYDAKLPLRRTAA